MNPSNESPQLRMVWSNNDLAHSFDHPVPDGYSLRTYCPGIEDQFFKLMTVAGWNGWNKEVLQPWLAKILPDGWFMIADEDSNEILYSAMSLHNYKGTYPFWGELGWLAGHPNHSGKGLGLVVSAAATDRLIKAGYKNIQLFTEEYRLPAIKTYLKLGYIPSFYIDGMAGRWENICNELSWPFTPNLWDNSN
jgi:mycothiol synthase